MIPKSMILNFTGVKILSIGEREVFSYGASMCLLQLAREILGLHNAKIVKKLIIRKP